MEIRFPAYDSGCNLATSGMCQSSHNIVHFVLSLKMCSVTSKRVGVVDNDVVVWEYELKSKNTCIRCVNYGATILSIVHQKGNKSDELTLNYRSFEELYNNIDEVPYYGCVVGRVANRTALGKFSIDGKEYTLATNNGENHLHGGLIGFNKVVWNASVLEDTSGSVGIRFTHISVDGDDGYVGNLNTTVIYKLTSDDKLVIEYFADTDSATPINLTNHTYWNLSGIVQSQSGSQFRNKITDHQLYLNCNHFLPVNAKQIPTEEIKSVSGTLFDFSLNSGKLIGDHLMDIDGCGMPGLDHCYVIDNNEKYIVSFKSHVQDGVTTENTVQVPFVATLGCNGTYMDVYSTQPGVQVYTANWLLNNPNSMHSQHNAVCLECQHFPNAVNFKKLPDSNYQYKTSVESKGLLLPNEQYYHQTIYMFR